MSPELSRRLGAAAQAPMFQNDPALRDRWADAAYAVDEAATLDDLPEDVADLTVAAERELSDTDRRSADPAVAPVPKPAPLPHPHSAITGAEFHTHGHCEDCGAWLEGRYYCSKCGRGYAGPVLDAGVDPDVASVDAAAEVHRRLMSDTMSDIGDAGLVAAGGVTLEDVAPMTTIVPDTAAASVTVNGDPAQFLTVGQIVASSATGTLAIGDATAPPITATQPAVQAAPGMQPWAGVLAVEGRATGDGRMFRDGALYWDEGYLPSDLFAMLRDPEGGSGHDGSEICGRIDEMGKRPGPDAAATAAARAQLEAARLASVTPDAPLGYTQRGEKILAEAHVTKTWRQFNQATGYTEIWGRGFYDTSTPAGAEVFRLQQNGMLTGVSVDVDAVEVVMPNFDEMSEDDLLGWLFGAGGIEEYSAGRIRRATVCSIPAFIEARIFPVDQAHIYPVDQAGALTASAVSETTVGLRMWTPIETGPTATDGTVTLVASAAAFTPKAKEADVFHSPLVDGNPPAEVFARRDYTTYQPFTVDGDGRISGHVTPWGQCHIGMSDRCVTAPRSRCGYAHARTGHVLTAEGDLVATARVFAQFGPGRVHAPEELTAAPAVEWYESMTLAVGDVAVYEDAHGIQVQGRVRPGTSAQQVIAFRGSRISPDWRSIGGALECVGLAVVNVSGFTNSPRLPALVASAVDAGVDVRIPDADRLHAAAYVKGGEVLTLVASGGPVADQGGATVASVIDRLAARVDELEQAELTRQADALLAGVPSDDEIQAALAAQIDAALAGVDLDEPLSGSVAASDDSDVPTVAGLTADDLATLSKALEITQRLTQRPVDQVQAADGDTVTCPSCGFDGVPADATECPRCGEPMSGSNEGALEQAGEVVTAAAGSCGCAEACACK